ncbi:MAG: DUF4783 domain-containing protein [Flavobacteriales bacterium]|nr:MAG: DUF4783 domain-containing protein [Flavobacteriales bacterium]
MLRNVLCTILITLFPLVSFGQATVKDQVVQALKTGNSKLLAQHFIANIDLTTPSGSEIYSKTQAEQILRKFFDEQQPVDMVIEHSGESKQGDKYHIGILRTAKGYFRVTFFLKKTGEVLQVKQLRIETGNDGF